MNIIMLFEIELCQFHQVKCISPMRYIHKSVIHIATHLNEYSKQ